MVTFWLIDYSLMKPIKNYTVNNAWVLSGTIIIIRYLYHSFKKIKENCLIKRKSDSEIHFKEASDFFENKMYNEAIECYTKAISIYPIVLYYNDRAYTYFFLNKINNAIEDYNEAIKLEPNESHFYLWRGKAYFILNYFEKSENDWKKSLELGSTYAKDYLRIYFESKPSWFIDLPKINHFENIITNENQHLNQNNNCENNNYPYCQSITYLNESTYDLFLN